MRRILKVDLRVFLEIQLLLFVFRQIPAQQFVQVPANAINLAQLVSLQGQQALTRQEARPSGRIFLHAVI